MLDKALELQGRTKRFAISVIQLFKKLPRTEEARILGRQVLRSGTSIAANYRATCRSRSKAEFIAKIGTVVEEADETVFWLELLVESQVIPHDVVELTLREANELLAIFSASRSTAKGTRKPNR